jgi:Dyp-type peroxidase family
MDMEPQQALRHSPGLYSALSVWRLVGESARSQVAEVAGALYQELGRVAGVHALVALEAGLVREAPPAPAVLPLEGPAARLPSTQAQLLVQLAAESREALLLAQRRLAPLCAGVLTLQEELLGGRIGPGREPFGFLDAVRVPTSQQVQGQALVPEGPLKGGSWVLYLRFLQDLERFGRLRLQAQEQVLGRTKEGTRLEPPPDTAHILRARAGCGAPFVRRSFPYRQYGEEGLAFLAAAARPEDYVYTLRAMLGLQGPQDALLRYATAVGGGLYLAPPESWLRARFPLEAC